MTGHISLGLTISVRSADPCSGVCSEFDQGFYATRGRLGAASNLVRPTKFSG